MLLGVAQAEPHDDLEKQIATVTEELRLSPKHEPALIRRADLYRRHEQWDEAFADLEAVLHSRDQASFVGVQARLFRDMECWRTALVVLSTFLARAEDPDLRLLRAEVRAAHGKLKGALSDYDAALAKHPHPAPDHFLARARVTMSDESLGRTAIERAIGGLDQGLERLGPLASLHLAAIDLEVSREGFEAAIERIDLMAARSPRKESWWVRRAEVLRIAGRTEEALENLEQALLAIRSLKPKQRRAIGVRLMEEQVLEAMKALRLEEVDQEGSKESSSTPAPEPTGPQAILLLKTLP